MSRARDTRTARPVRNGKPAPAPAAPPAPARKVGWRWRSANRLFGIIEISADGRVDAYLFRWLGETTFSLAKLEAARETTYTVHVNGGAALCGCDAIRKGGASTCRHIDAVRALLARDKA